MNNFLKNNRRSLLVLTFVVLLVAFVLFLNKFSQFSKNLPMVGTPASDVGASLTESEFYTSESAVSSFLSDKSFDDDALSYGDFIKTFGERRIQFDDACRATPLNSSFMVGDRLILDNRSDKVQAVKFVDDLYALPPYHVRVFELKRQGIFYIDCGSSKNVAEVIVH